MRKCIWFKSSTNEKGELHRPDHCRKINCDGGLKARLNCDRYSKGLWMRILTWTWNLYNLVLAKLTGLIKHGHF